MPSLRRDPTQAQAFSRHDTRLCRQLQRSAGRIERQPGGSVSSFVIPLAARFQRRFRRLWQLIGSWRSTQLLRQHRLEVDCTGIVHATGGRERGWVRSRQLDVAQREGFRHVQISVAGYKCIFAMPMPSVNTIET
jgi:hypothetical protein